MATKKPTPKKKLDNCDVAPGSKADKMMDKKSGAIIIVASGKAPAKSKGKGKGMPAGFLAMMAAGRAKKAAGKKRVEVMTTKG